MKIADFNAIEKINIVLAGCLGIIHLTMKYILNIGESILNSVVVSLLTVFSLATFLIIARKLLVRSKTPNG